MNKYEVIEPLGEGSFGRVYKAKILSTSTFVALKVICTRGRSPREIKGLRQECEIQRRLNHPNIIKMLDSFETENEIVVITEFAHKALNTILGKEGFLPEERVQPIVWDLVSALYYLHSHRVLHRDLKPQNILMDSTNRAKLCDFGFARNMSTGTHVLTSVKGTPLYMAPELIEEQPYDHNADLWSLGCIIYELLVGEPPFCTTSILRLIRLIKYEHIQWPTFISDNCITFLKGLLQKNPSKRLQWEEILKHPFIEGHLLILQDDTTMPLTRVLSENTLQIKEQQKKNKILNKSPLVMLPNDNKIEQQNIKRDGDGGLQEKIEKMSLGSQDNSNHPEPQQKSQDKNEISPISQHQPIETDEWIVFLQKSMEELINGETTTLTQRNLINILISPLRNSNSTPKVLNNVVKLFSLPFVIENISNETLQQIQKVYFEAKLIPNLVYASKLIFRVRNSESSSASSSSPIVDKFQNVSDLNDESLQCLECIYLLIAHLVYLNEEFLSQFCDALMIINLYSIINSLLTCKNRINLIADLMSILTHVLRVYPENYELIESIILPNNTDNKTFNFIEYLRHNESILRQRSCIFLMFLGKYSNKIELLWNEMIRETLEALMYDSIESVRNAADKTVEELKSKEFYQKIVEQSEDNL